MKKLFQKDALLGILFILPLFFYGVGNAFINSIWGLISMLINSLLVVLIGIIVYERLKHKDSIITQLYLIVRVLEAVLLTIGIISIMTGNSILNVIQNGDLMEYILGFQNYCYQISMWILGMGSIPFCFLLLKEKWIPAYLSWGGIIGYALLAIGAFLELFGQPYGIYLSIPGGLFELFFGVYLILFGFKK